MENICGYIKLYTEEIRYNLSINKLRSEEMEEMEKINLDVTNINQIFFEIKNNIMK